ISDSPGCGLGQRFTQSMASCREATSHNQKPAISSLVSVKGPSVTRRCLPANVTRAPFELGCRPSPASMTPAFTNSSLNLPISASSCVFVFWPFLEFFLVLTKSMNCMGCLLWGCGWVVHAKAEVPAFPPTSGCFFCPPLERDQHLETAPDHALAIERQRRG